MKNIAIIGSGATSIYLLKHLLDKMSVLKKEMYSISIFEKNTILGMGMPYNPITTDLYNLSNISSEELPDLEVTFEDWLKKQSVTFLKKMEIEKDKISKSEVYNRLALGQYLQSQYQSIIQNIKDFGIQCIEYPNTEIIDITYNNTTKFVSLHSTTQLYEFDKVIIATGHQWEDDDQEKNGFYASPWPIHKILPQQGTFHNFTIGTLGASLSAFDVVSSLSRRHGKFVTDSKGNYTYQPYKGTDNFKMVMHAAHGWLPHLQYEQEKPIREIYRHFDRKALYNALDEDGFLTLSSYFTNFCVPALSKAFQKDNLTQLSKKITNVDYTFKDFVTDMADKHEYDNPFEGMREEMKQASVSITKNKPIHWKEVIDDLMYALNFHAELLPAEDHIFFRKEIMPFLMNVIAAMPLPSAKILLALYDANKIEIVPGYVNILENKDFTTIEVTHKDTQTIHLYQMFINCSGQRAISVDDYPFPTLVKEGYITPPQIPFKKDASAMELTSEEKEKIIKKGNTSLYELPGITINSSYCLVNANGDTIEAIQDISFAHSSGLRPYSYGLQACSATSEIVVANWVASFQNKKLPSGDLKEVSKIYEKDPQL
ncbi:FAD/NAD(P)-binding protein [Flavobacterium profundi]|uniref:FAD/NAD(P)-binding protein n=1 Tax=Flavobacterium profundi TaxID=1774945 RepID=UPI0012F73BA2|nr:FAD/NAD(P)-binding protein [Flavobacterium profundi]